MILCPHCYKDVAQTLTAQELRSIYGRLSTATDTQEERIVGLLREGPKTSPQLDAAGCVQYTARIHGLRARGYVISMTRYNGIGNDGQWHKGLALYRLVSEPVSPMAQSARRGRQKPVEATNGGEAVCHH